MASIFTKIINGEIPSYKIAEDEFCYAFLDINPVQKGHTLIVPKLEVNRLFDLDDQSYAHLMLFAKKISKGIKASFNCDRVGMTVIGLEVPHAHLHLIPINNLQDMSFLKPKLKLETEEFSKIASTIIDNL